MTSRFTNGIVEFSSAFDKGFDKYTPFLRNNYVVGILLVLLIIYSSLIAPSLPYQVLKVFDYWFVKLVAFFLIVYISMHNATVALLVAVAVMVSIYALNKAYHSESMTNVSGMSDDLSGLMKNSTHQLRKNNYKDYANTLNMQMNMQTNSALLYDKVSETKPETMKSEGLLGSIGHDLTHGTSEVFNKLKSYITPGKFVSLHEESLSGIPMNQHIDKKSKVQEMASEVETIMQESNLSMGEIKNVCSSVLENNKLNNDVDGYDETPIYGAPNN